MISFFKTHAAAVNRWRKRLIQSRFFTVSLLLHTILVMVMSTTVLFQRYVEPPDFTGGDGGGFVSGDPSAQPPPNVQQPIEQQPTFTVQTVTQNTNPIQAITTAAISESNFVIPSIITPVTPGTEIAQPVQVTTPKSDFGQGLTGELARDIRGFTGGWAKGGSGGPGSDPRQREFEFTAYLAKYKGGDWNSTVRVDSRTNTIVHGSLPNLLYIIGTLSRDRIKAAPQAKPLDLASEEIYSTKPPFILFTGHRDFTLTDKEVENLRKYIRLGGCLWGDSSLPGLRSKFDLAFRREMRRIIPDADKDWEEVPMTHPLFTRKLYWDIKTIPPGLNYYREKLYCLKAFGEIAVLYTPNDYCDMWQFGLDENWQFFTGRDEHGNMVAMNEEMYRRKDIFYRNITPESVKLAYQFGMNIIVHLITRWEDRLRTVPQSL